MQRSKILIRAGMFLLLLLLINTALSYVLIPNSIARVNLYRAGTTAYDDLFIGTSHGMSALSPEHFDMQTGRRSTNLCMPNERMVDSYYMIRQICRNQMPKRIIYELDPVYWSCPYTNGESTNYIYAHMPAGLLKLQYAFDKNAGRDLRDTLFPWHYYRGDLSLIPARIREKSSGEYRSCSIDPLSTEGQAYTAEGFLRQYADPDGFKIGENYMLWDRDAYEERESIYFDKLVEFCRANAIELIVITTPIPEESYQTHRDCYVDAHTFFSEYMELRGISYLDCTFPEILATIKVDGFEPTIRGYLDHEGHMLVGQAEAFSTWLGRQLQ